MSSMKVDIAAISVGVLIIESFQPQNPTEDGVIAFFALPDGAGETALEAGEDGGAFPDLLADDEIPGRGAVGAFFETGAIGGSRDGGLEDGVAALGDGEALVADRNFD